MMGHAQQAAQDITIKKVKIVDNTSPFGYRQLKITDNELQKVMIRVKIDMDDDRAKLSAFSLIDKVNKLRYRLADYKGYEAFIGQPELIPLRKSPFLNKNGKPINRASIPAYDASEKDYFLDFNQPGYTNEELEINFGSTENPNISIVYFGTTEFTNFTAELFFAIWEKYKGADYELYYKGEKVSDIKFQ